MGLPTADPPELHDSAVGKPKNNTVQIPPAVWLEGRGLSI